MKDKRGRLILTISTKTILSSLLLVALILLAFLNSSPLTAFFLANAV
jgi:hypothetical protein